MKNKAVSYISAKVKLTCLVSIISMLTASLTLNSSAAAYDPVTEPDLRAAIILRIMPLVIWPESPSPMGQLNFCATGKTDTTASLKEFINAQPKLGINFLQDSESTNNNICHVQILGAGQKPIDTNSNDPLLVICDGCSSGTDNAAIEVIKIKDAIKFNLNVAEAKRRSIRFKTTLMEHANQVKGVP